MPRHKQVTTCLKGGGPLSKFCSCVHCCCGVCEVCGAYEGSLTTDCPGERVSYDRQTEVYETPLDYTDDRGWHQGASMQLRSPRFEDAKLPPTPPTPDPRAHVAPAIDWIAVDRNVALKDDLEKKAIAWVIADRICEERSAKLTRVEDEAKERIRPGQDLGVEESALMAKLESERIDFRLTDHRAQRCEDEFKQAARVLVDALEKSSLVVLPTSEDDA